MQKVQAEVVSVADKQIAVLPCKGAFSDKLFGFAPPQHTELSKGDIVIIEINENNPREVSWSYS